MSTATASRPAAAPTPDQDLQARLAKRLRQLDTDERALPSWMAVEIGRRALLVPLSHSSEIVPWQRPSPVPHTKPWFMGMVNWRGDLSGVVDMASYLDVDPPKRSEQALASCKLLSFNPALEINAVLLIDRMMGLKSVNDFDTAYAPANGNTTPFLGSLYADAHGKLWQELNLQRLAQQPEFLSIRT